MLARRLAEHLDPGSSTYYEPFAGSAAMFFRLEPEAAVLGDLNSELIQALRQLRDFPEQVAKTVLGLPATKRTYYDMRAREPEHLAALDRAVRFFYLNRRCFNGIYRTNRSGRFNVPMGARTGNPPALDVWLAASECLRRARLRDDDFVGTLVDVEKNDLVYLDPPYTLWERSYSGEYGYGSFQVSDLEKLVEEMTRLHALGARVLVSYKDCPDLRDMGAEWTCSIESVFQHVSASTDSRRRGTELLLHNFSLGEYQNVSD